jgi:hypothetical protein
MSLRHTMNAKYSRRCLSDLEPILANAPAVQLFHSPAVPGRHRRSILPALRAILHWYSDTLPEY